MTPHTHQDCLGHPVTPGDWLTDGFVTLEVTRLYGSGQFVHVGDSGELETNFCCCFTVCTPPAQQSHGESLAAPTVAGQGVSIHVAAARTVQWLLGELFCLAEVGTLEEVVLLNASNTQDLRVLALERVA